MQLTNPLKSLPNPLKNVTNPFKSFSTIELSLLVVFIIYIILPIHTPQFLSGAIDNPISLVIMFGIAVYLFIYSNPVLAILYIFVAYELLRRTSNSVVIKAVQHTPSQVTKDKEMKQMNPKKAETLEEEIVEKMAPVGRSDASVYVSSSYKPTAEKLVGASLF
jgi:uncharacterized membrane protein (DUF485 family)